jgi:hypothetical protein
MCLCSKGRTCGKFPKNHKAHTNIGGDDVRFTRMGLILGLCPIAAIAQSAVTIYGSIDTGVTMVSSKGGHSVALLDAGNMAPDRIG